MSQNKSPFKFLDSYEKEDVNVFFGRNQETLDLCDALSGVKHLLVYGPSGSGKTSLVECGLRNQFSDADWFALTIRKGWNINASVFMAINDALKDKIVLDPKTKLPSDPEIGFGEAIEKLFEERYQPVYLLFDQFEELLITGEQQEKIEFFTNLNILIRNRLPSRVLLIMREEFIGHFSEFESLCPSIFQHRFRVEKMGRKQVQEVIQSMLEAPQYRDDFDVKDSHKLAESILAKLPDKRKEIELSHVQVFLGELWDRADEVKTENELPVFDANLLTKNDNLESVLESFLNKQIKELEVNYGERVPLELLAVMISERFTKLQLSAANILVELTGKKVTCKRPLSELLQELQTRRIIRAIKVGEESQYEISHDTLALVVGQNLTEDMKMREKAMDIYKVLMEKEGLFSQDDIDYLRPFKRNLNYPPDLQRRLKESHVAIQEQRQKEVKQKISDRNKKKKLRLLGGALVVLIGFVALFIHLAVKAQEQTILAKKNKIEATKAEDYANELLRLVMIGRGEQYEGVSDSILKNILFKQRTYPIERLIVPKASVSKSNLGGNYRNFSMWIDLPSFRKDEIKEVQYNFCSGFIDRKRTSSDPTSSFSIGYLGEGYCPMMYIDIILKSGEIIKKEYSFIDYFKNNPAE
jgi:hypothetical protein